MPLFVQFSWKYEQYYWIQLIVRRTQSFPVDLVSLISVFVNIWATLNRHHQRAFIELVTIRRTSIESRVLLEKLNGSTVKCFKREFLIRPMYFYEILRDFLCSVLLNHLTQFFDSVSDGTLETDRKSWSERNKRKIFSTDWILKLHFRDNRSPRMAANNIDRNWKEHDAITSIFNFILFFIVKLPRFSFRLRSFFLEK